jgi:hypothetical protein
LKLECDEPLSNVALKFKSRRYMKGKGASKLHLGRVVLVEIS